MSPCKIEDYKNISNILKEKLGLTKSPVAIKMFLDEKDAKETLSKIDENTRHCQMVQKAINGSSFYATLNEEACKGGAAAIGLCDFPKALSTGKKYYSLGKFASIGSAKHELEQVPKIDTIMNAIGYSALENAKFEADVIIIICKPEQALLIIQAEGFVLGKRFKADFAGIQSVCADAVAAPYTRKEPNITLGCTGSRKFAEIKPEELIIGLPAENIGCIINSLESIT